MIPERYPQSDVANEYLLCPQEKNREALLEETSYFCVRLKTSGVSL